MRHNTKDQTLQRSFLQKFRFIIKEYELVKNKRHPQFKFVQDFYRFHHTNRQTFLKYYHRFKQSGNPNDLLPGKRGPKWKTRRPIPFIESKVIALRLKGNNRYEISAILQPLLSKYTPRPSGVYNILRRQGLNKLNQKMIKERKRIIKKKAGELGHVDVHYLASGIIQNENQRLYLVCVIDSCTRIAWAEVVSDIKALTVMFATLKALNLLKQQYDIQFQEVISDNGPEFGHGKHTKKKDEHPFERMLMELGIKHRYTRPYRPQTNGKVERFWKTIEEDLLSETCFETEEELKDELIQYLYYYNHERPHQGLNGKIPAGFNQELSTN